MQGNVKVYPPFVPCLCGVFRCMIQGNIEILVPRYDLVVFCDYDLVKINVFPEIRKPLEVVLAGVGLQSRAQMKLTYSYARVIQASQSFFCSWVRFPGATSLRSLLVMVSAMVMSCW